MQGTTFKDGHKGYINPTRPADDPTNGKWYTTGLTLNRLKKKKKCAPFEKCAEIFHEDKGCDINLLLIKNL